jgi:predicted phosphodiesterase
MPQPPLARDVVADRMATYAIVVGEGFVPFGTHCGIGRKAAAKEAARRLGISEGTMVLTVRRAAQIGLVPEGLPESAKPPEGFVIKEQVVRVDRRGKVLSRTIRNTRESGEVFTPRKGHIIKGESALVDADGRTIAKWLKTKEGPVGDWVEAFRTAIENIVTPLDPIPSPANDDESGLTTYQIADPHLGMHAWAKQTGDPYDLKIACDTVLQAVSSLVEQARPTKKALIIWLGDTTHQNDRTNMTPRSGHVLDVDGRFQKVLAAAAELALRLGELAAKKHEEVIIRFVEGNHDPEAALALTLALSLYFRNNERVTVDDSPSPHWYYRHGRVLIGATHGHTMKPDRMAMMMAVDRPEDWGSTKYRHFFFGHIHHDSVKEVGGVRVESFNSPAAKDAYAHAGGWRSGRALTAITFDAERGEVGRHRVNIG